MVYVFVSIIATIIGIIYSFCNYNPMDYLIGNIICSNIIFVICFTLINLFVLVMLTSTAEMIPIETVGIYELIPYEENNNIYSVHVNASTDRFYFKYVNDANQKKEDYCPSLNTVISTDSNESVKPAIKIEKLDYKNPILRFFFFALDEKKVTITVNDTSQILNY